MFSMGFFFQCMKNLHEDSIYHCESDNVDYLNTVLNTLIKWSLRGFWGKIDMKCRFRFCQVCYQGQFSGCLPRGNRTLRSSSSPPLCPRAATALSASFQKLLYQFWPGPLAEYFSNQHNLSNSQLFFFTFSLSLTPCCKFFFSNELHHNY